MGRGLLSPVYPPVPRHGPGRKQERWSRGGKKQGNCASRRVDVQIGSRYDGRAPAVARRDQPMAKKHDVDLVRIIARASVIKTIAICVVILGGLITVCVTAYKMTDKPPWLVVVLAAITVLASGSGSAGMTLWLRRRYIAKHHRDRVELEEHIDPNRKSSEP